MGSTTDRAPSRQGRLLAGAVAVLSLLLAASVVAPAAMGGNPPGNPVLECADEVPGSVLIAKFEVEGNSYVFEKPEGNEGIVTLSNTTLDGGDWTSTVPISAVIVKGGQGSHVVLYDPPVTSGTFSNAGLPPVGQGNIPDISNVQFCGPVPSTSTTAPQTTTSEPTTSTTGATTTEAPTTTTTEATTTTTEAPTTTTTEATTTTTTEAPTTTTTEATTTTTEATTTTTEPGSTTTTDGPTTTGPLPQVAPGGGGPVDEGGPQGPQVAPQVLSRQDPLPVTGSGLRLAVIAFGLLGGGGVLLLVARARRGAAA